MDNIKKAQDMAQQAGSAMSAGMPDAGDAAYAQNATKIWNEGLPAVATVKSISETGKTDMSGKQYAIEVSLEKDGETYDATVLQYLIEAAVASYQPGARVNAKVHPDDKSIAMLYDPA
jgi:hypothetical protein